MSAIIYALAFVGICTIFSSLIVLFWVLNKELKSRKNKTNY